MKYIFLLFTLISLSASAQTDSSKLYVRNLSFQARDLEAVVTLLASAELYEDFFTLAKSKFAINNPPSGTAVVVIDSIRVDAYLGLLRHTYYLPNGLAGNFTSRIVQGAKSLSATDPVNVYVKRELEKTDEFFTTQYNNQRTEGRRRLRQIRN